jgi:hypothetical protein
MAERSGELRNSGPNGLVQSGGGEPRRGETPTSRRARWLLKSVGREFAAALPGQSEEAVLRSASRTRICAGKEGKLTFNLLAPILPPKSLEPSHATMRRIFIAGVTRSFVLCVLIIQSCRARSIGTMPANYFKSISSIAAQPGSPRALKEINLALTPPRAYESRLAGLSASVDETAHPDVHCHAQRQKREQHRRSTVTH